ncbi:MAG TPA: inositol monophosphatase family protein [Thermoleophilaceae bacterium]|nr:inositol monophosphatase family protein [Thermoleophilaceae bacterium]
MTADVEVAERAARAGGEVLMAYYGRPPEGLGVKSSATDPVSDADREAERAIRELLSAERPADGLVAEEGSHAEADSGRRWVVDPLDGTVNFIYELPAWAVSVALEDADGVAAGVVHSPVLGETFCAVRGGGAWIAESGRPLRASGCDRLERAMVATGFSYEPARRVQQAAVVARLLPLARDIRRAGAAALDLAWTAAGRLDAFYENGLKRWDWAAGHLLVQEAGGVTGWIGGEPPVLVAAATPTLLDELRPLAG